MRLKRNLIIDYRDVGKGCTRNGILITKDIWVDSIVGALNAPGFAATIVSSSAFRFLVPEEEAEGVESIYKLDYRDRLSRSNTYMLVDYRHLTHAVRCLVACG